MDFAITSDDNINLDKPTLYNNLANPITLSYVNSNIKTDYTLTNTTNPITYDGSLLKKCNVLLNTISCNFSVPLEQKDKSIYDGNITLKNDKANFIFYRYK